MNAIKLQLLWLFNIFYVSDCVRRIQGGTQVLSKKSYMVYLVKSPKSSQTFKDWLCGGALVNNLFIITAQACVNDVDHMFAIAGYDKYVTDAEIDTDQCTKEKKKKVVYLCVPKQDDTNAGQWGSLIDIALVKVESPYDFEDQSYKTLCSYIPSAIPINYEERYQKPGTDGLVLGWGHVNQWRQPNDSTNYNKDLLQYASVKIMDKKECQQFFKQYPQMDIDVVDRYMICSKEKGELDEHGKVVQDSEPPAKIDGCGGVLRSMSYYNANCEEYLTRGELLKSNTTNDFGIGTELETLLNLTNESLKSGFCQNDHGGPLVTWVGTSEVLIGVASIFPVTDDNKCTGPYLYTSTACNGAFIDSVLSNMNLPDNKNGLAICSSPPSHSNSDTDEKQISWKHLAGEAESKALTTNTNLEVDKLNTKERLSIALKGIIKLVNENVAIRPQIPLKQ